MINLNELARGGTICLGNAGLAVDGSAKEDAETLANFPFAINGLAYTLSSGDGDVKLDDNTVTKGYTALFLACVNASGTITVVKSAEVSNTDLAAGVGVLNWPTPTVNTCAFGALKVKNGSAAVFTGGTTALDAADITTTYINLLLVPEAPLTS